MMLKYRILLLLSLTFQSLCLSAQPWKLIHPERTYVFGFDDGMQIAYDRVIYTDTFFISGSDTVYHNYPVMMTPGGGSSCFEHTNQGPGWLGKYVVETPGGDYLLRNINGDSMWIESNAPAGSNWVFMLKPDGTYYGASVTSITWDTVPGAWDSVKVITLQKYDPTSTPVFSMWNGAQIRIGRNMGLLKAVDFFNFDWIPSDISCVLAGISNPDAGVQIPGPRELYDFQAGDVFQYSYIQHLFFGGGGYIIDTIYSQQTILSRYESPLSDTVLYSMEKQSWKHSKQYSPPSPPTDSILLNSDTIPVLITEFSNPASIGSWHPEHNFPGQVYTEYVDSASPGGYFPAEPWAMNNTFSEPAKYNGRTQRNYHIWMVDSLGDSCISTPIISGSYGFSIYAEGLGFVYASFDDVMNTWEDKLTCFTKGAETWGTCLDFSILMSRTEVSHAEEKLALYPNPASQEMYFKTDHQTGNQIQHFRVTNMLGQTLLEGAHPEGNKISVTRLPEGFYLIMLTTASGKSLHAKFEVMR